MPDTPVVLTNQQLEELLAKAVSSNANKAFTLEELERCADNVVKKVFTSFGVDAAQTLEVQQDFAFLRSLRKGSESVRAKAIVTTVGLLITGGISLLAMGIKSWFSGAPAK